MNYYSQMYPQQYNQQYQYPNQMQNNLPQQSIQSVTQSDNLIRVHNEEEARIFPVGPGHSVIFKDENQPYIYVKTMGFSQLDRPIFEKYKLIKEELPETQVTENSDKYALKNDLFDLINKVADLQEQIVALKDSSRKREDRGNTNDKH